VSSVTPSKQIFDNAKMNNHHLIDNALFDITFYEKAVIVGQGSEINDFVKSNLMNVIDEVFDNVASELGSTSAVFRIDKLEIDLGEISYADFREQMPKKLREKLLLALRDAHHAAAEEPTAISKLLDSSGDAQAQLFYFLRNGFLPWYSRFTDPNSLELLLINTIESTPAALIDILRDKTLRTRVLERLTKQFSKQSVQQLMDILPSFQTEDNVVEGEFVTALLKGNKTLILSTWPELYQEQAQLLKNILRHYGQQSIVRDNIAACFSPEQFEELVLLLEPVARDFVQILLQHKDLFDSIDQHSSNVRPPQLRELREFTLAYLLVEPGAGKRFNRKSYLVDLLKDISLSDAGYPSVVLAHLSRNALRLSGADKRLVELSGLLTELSTDIASQQETATDVSAKVTDLKTRDNEVLTDTSSQPTTEKDLAADTTSQQVEETNVAAETTSQQVTEKDLAADTTSQQATDQDLSADTNSQQATEKNLAADTTSQPATEKDLSADTTSQQVEEKDLAAETTSQQATEKDLSADTTSQQATEKDLAAETTSQQATEKDLSADTTSQPATEKDLAAETTSQQATEKDLSADTTSQQVEETNVAAETSSQQATDQELAAETNSQQATEKDLAADTNSQQAIDQGLAAETNSQQATEKDLAADTTSQLATEKDLAAETNSQQATEKDLRAETNSQQATEEDLAAETNSQPVTEKDLAAETTSQPSTEKDLSADTNSQPVTEKDLAAETTSQPSTEKDLSADTNSQPATDQDLSADTTSQQATEKDLAPDIANPQARDKNFPLSEGDDKGVQYENYKRLRLALTQVTNDKKYHDPDLLEDIKILTRDGPYWLKRLFSELRTFSREWRQAIENISIPVLAELSSGYLSAKKPHDPAVSSGSGVDLLSTIHRYAKQSQNKHAFYIRILSDLIDDRVIDFNAVGSEISSKVIIDPKPSVSEHPIQNTAHPYANALSPTTNTTSEAQSVQNEQPVPIENIYIDNAGSVLFAAYLPRLFEQFGWVEEGEFINLDAAEHGVHCVQFLVNESTSSPEFQLVLNKLLCGIEPEVPIRRSIELTTDEQEQLENLLHAITQHWKPLANSSIGGLRESFLQRNGRLQLKGDAWYLSVEAKAFDMLLEQLPWSYSTIKFPWMERPIYTEWR
jgi:hypothetical protein